MTAIIQDLQKQSSTNFIILYELILPSGGTLFFHPGVQANTANVTFDGNTYIAIPAEITGIEISSDGVASRPTLTVSNVLTTFKDAIGAGYTFNDLLGKKFTRRRTLSAYLASAPAVEYTKDIFYVDRIIDRSIVSVTFELASPFDLQGVQLPQRIIMAGGCPWKYQGASHELTEVNKEGGCSWNTYSQLTIGGTTYTNFVNITDEPVVINTANVATWAGSGTINNIYRTAQTGLVKINNNGTMTQNANSDNFWQVMVASTSNTPSDTDAAFRRVRTYTAYSNTTTYTVFTDASYNSYVSNTFGGGVRLFRKKYLTQANTAQGADPGYNDHWELADSCGKKQFSCTRRFQFRVATSNSQTVPNTVYDQTVILPFGGYPGSRLYQ